MMHTIVFFNLFNCFSSGVFRSRPNPALSFKDGGFRGYRVRTLRKGKPSRELAAASILTVLRPGVQSSRPQYQSRNIDPPCLGSLHPLLNPANVSIFNPGIKALALQQGAPAAGAHRPGIAARHLETMPHKLWPSGHTHGCILSLDPYPVPPNHALQAWADPNPHPPTSNVGARSPAPLPPLRAQKTTTGKRNCMPHPLSH